MHAPFNSSALFKFFFAATANSLSLPLSIDVCSIQVQSWLVVVFKILRGHSELQDIQHRLKVVLIQMLGLLEDPETSDPTCETTIQCFTALLEINPHLSTQMLPEILGTACRQLLHWKAHGKPNLVSELVIMFHMLFKMFGKTGIFLHVFKVVLASFANFCSLPHSLSSLTGHLHSSITPCILSLLYTSLTSACLCCSLGPSGGCTVVLGDIDRGLFPRAPLAIVRQGHNIYFGRTCLGCRQAVFRSTCM